MKITVNPDPEVVEIAKQSLKESGGQCPCVLPQFRNANSHCMCKDFRDKINQGYEGYCNCEYYYVTQQND